ncbi:MAG: hypothetical protein HY719_08735, partial [Planctomycetes bacterium]|nr:hypothetical protein [Planctomycetota bacterium]
SIRLDAANVTNANNTAAALSVAGGVAGKDNNSASTADGGAGAPGYVRANTGVVGTTVSPSNVSPSTALSLGEAARLLSAPTTEMSIDTVAPGAPTITVTSHQAPPAMNRATKVDADFGKATATPTPDHFFYLITLNPAATAAEIQAGTRSDTGVINDATAVTGGGTWYLHVVSANSSNLLSTSAKKDFTVDPYPFITKRETADTNGNGKIDAVVFTLNEKVNDDFGDLVVEVTGYTVTAVNSGATAKDAIITATLQEGAATDTGATPPVLVKANTKLVEDTPPSGQTAGPLQPEAAAVNATDGAPPLMTVTLPTATSTQTSLNMDYTLSETLKELTIIWTEVGTTIDAGSPHNVLMTTAADLASGAHTGVLPSPQPALIKGAKYNLSISPKDLAGKTPAAPVTITGVTYNLPVIFNTAPASGANVSLPRVSYNLSQVAQALRVTWTRTGGTADPASPQITNLTGANLNAGAHTNVTLAIAPVDGAVYDVAFDVTDSGGAPVPTVKSTGVNYDTRAPIISQRKALDTDGNGKIDTIRVTCDEPINDAFAGATVTVTGYTVKTVATGAAPNDAIFDVTLTELAVDPSQTPSTKVSPNNTLADRAGNLLVADPTNVVATDGVNPVLSGLFPAKDGWVGAPKVDYRLNEVFASLSVVVTRTGGSADAGSPYTVNFTSSADLLAGNHQGVDVSAVLANGFVEGAVYSLAWSGADVAALTVSQTVTNVTGDRTAPTVLARDLVDNDNNGLTDRVLIRCSEPLNDRFSGLAITVTGFTVDAQPFETGPVANDAEFFVRLVEGAQNPANVTIQITANVALGDRANNLLAVEGAASPASDRTAPAFSNVSPANNRGINAVQMGWTLSEAVAAATATFTRISGAADSGSPYVVTLAGTDLAAGARALGPLAPAPSLVDGTTYTIALVATDAAGNKGTPFTVVGVAFDTTPPQISGFFPTDNATTNGSLITYTLSERLTAATITWTQIGGTADPLSPHTVTFVGSELTAGAHDSVLLANAPVLTDGAIYNVEFSGKDVADNLSNVVKAQNVQVGTAASGGGNLKPFENTTGAPATVNFCGTLADGGPGSAAGSWRAAAGMLLPALGCLLFLLFSRRRL